MRLGQRASRRRPIALLDVRLRLAPQAVGMKVGVLPRPPQLGGREPVLGCRRQTPQAVVLGPGRRELGDRLLQAEPLSVPLPFFERTLRHLPERVARADRLRLA